MGLIVVVRSANQNGLIAERSATFHRHHLSSQPRDLRRGHLPEPIEFVDAANNRPLFVGTQPRKDGEAQHFAGRSFGLGQAAGTIVVPDKALLQVQRVRIVDFGPYALFG